MKIRTHDLAVCSWSLGTSDPRELVEGLGRLDVSHVHLALHQYLELDAAGRRQYAASLLDGTGIGITATMIGFPGERYDTIARIRETGGFGPDHDWENRKRIALAGAAATRELGATRMSTHIGFVPDVADDPDRYDVFVGRVREVVDAMAPLGVELVLESGQERASVLAGFLDDVGRKNLGVNFDPANMILYGAGDPVAAVRTLGRRIAHVHVKDATASTNPGVEWGTETPVGDGAVPWRTFLDALDDVGYRGALAIEREGGPNRMGEVGQAIRVLQGAA